MSDSNEIDVSNVLRIMVATDSHLGYCEKDAIRGDDSFIAFEEMLTMAVEENVDFILLGGDLFHDAVPSPNSMHKCMALLRRYVFGDKEIHFEILSDQSLNFFSAINDTVNYEDPNLNISFPVFSIHGNHDDPSSFGRLSSLDLLSTTGLVNYIGRWTDLTKVEIKPLLLRKGETKLSIYGLSHIHDERLARLFETYKVDIECPQGEKDEWFHLMVLHQNRAMRGHKNYLPEDILPEFLNLVIWGHEHDCRIEPEYVPKKDFYISQPGSSVATSLAEGEAIQKHVGILEIYKDKFKMQPLPLKTVRPFIFESIDLDEIAADGSLDGADSADKVRALAEEHIEKMIEKSKKLLTDHPKQPKLPLIRLRLVFSREEHMFNAMRFGQTYNDRVANPGDMVHFKKSIKRVKKEGVDFDKDAFNKAFKDMEIDANSRLEDLLERYFNDVDDSKRLQVMPTNLVSEITFQMVQRKDAVAVDNLNNNYEDKALECLVETMPNEQEIDDQLKEIQASITADDITKLSRHRESPKTSMSTAISRKRKVQDADQVNDDDDDDDLTLSKLGDNTSTKGTTARGRGRGRGRGARGARGASNNAARTAVTNGSTGSNTPTTSARSSRSGHTMPELDVSVSANRRTPRTTAQPTVLESFVGTRKAVRKKNVYVISDDSE